MDCLIAHLQNIRKCLSATKEVEHQSKSSSEKHETVQRTFPPASNVSVRNPGDEYFQTDSYSKERASDCDASSSKISIKVEPPSQGSSEEIMKPKALVDASKMIDSSLVQIRASKAEVERRIAAFINHKQSEVDKMNVREFCYGLPDSESSCARVDAVFVGRAGSSSHLKVTRVHNTHGPQTQFAVGSGVDMQSHHNMSKVANWEESVAERLRNVEEHLTVGRNSKLDIFNRLKVLEERVLFLEGVSPEYFQAGPPPPKRARPEAAPTQTTSAQPVQVKKEYQNLAEINQRILELQSALQQKAK